jgi:transposase
MVSDAQQFASARHFAAWLGLAPRQHSTGGNERIGRISKRGDSYVRRLLIHGARAVVQRVRAGQVKGAWIAGLLARRPFNVATVALANKTADRLGGDEQGRGLSSCWLTPSAVLLILRGQAL